MKVTRIYTGDDGRSHFEDLDIPMSDGPAGLISSRIATDSVFFREPAGNGRPPS